MSERDIVLRRIRAGLGRGPSDEEEAGRQRSAVESGARYRRQGERDRAALAEHFAERAQDYRVELQRIGEDGLPDAVAAVLTQHGATTVAAPADLPEAWCVPGVRWRRDGIEGATLGVDELDGCDAVVTACALAVADTGTLLFDGGAAQGRRMLTLLPDLHVCVVFEDQLVETVPEAVAASAAAARRGAPITLVSGPSATSDIELSRVEGVHGPRTLVVLLVRGPNG